MRGYGANANCTTLTAVLSDIHAGNMVADSDVIVDANEAALRTQCASWTPAKSTTPATSSGGSTAPGVPGAYWADSRVKEMQTLLNAELTRLKCSTQLKADGLIGAGTCGALQFASDAQKITQHPWGLTAFWAANGPSMLAGCKPFLPGKAPSCPAPQLPATVAPVVVASPPPAAPAVDGRALMVQLQGLLNQALIRFGYQPILVSGKWDGPTCGAGATVNPLLPLGDALRTQIGNLTAQVIAALGKPCGSTIAGVTPVKAAVAVPVPSPAPPKPVSPPPKPAPPTYNARTGLPPLNRDGECVLDYGSRYAEIGDLQRQMNTTLAANGFAPIAVTNVWDAATCGAMFALQGKFSPKASKSCPHYYSVPMSCPTSTAPKAKVAPPVEAPRNLLPWGLAALAAVGAAVYLKKKAAGA